MGRFIGIDLGTTYSAIAIVGDTGKPELVSNREGERITPSVVLFQGEMTMVGTQAKRTAPTAPHDVVQFVKRHMGEWDGAVTAVRRRGWRHGERVLRPTLVDVGRADPRSSDPRTTVEP